MEQNSLKAYQQMVVTSIFDIQMIISVHINRSPYRSLILTNFAKIGIGYIKIFALLVERLKVKPYIRLYIGRIVEYYTEHIDKPFKLFLKAIRPNDIESYEEIIDLKLVCFVT